MKKIPTSPCCFSPPRLLALPAAALLVTGLAMPSRAQIVIEGGPGVIQISDRDGKPEPVVPGGVTGGAPIALEKEPPAAAVLDFTRVKPSTVPAVPGSPVQVLVPVERPKTSARRTPLEERAREAAADAEPEVPPVDVEAVKRKAEIARELSIADSGTGARAAFFAEGLFEENSPEISTLAADSLRLLAEFIRLSEVQDVTVTYHYAPALHDEDLALRRSVSLVAWMKNGAGLGSTKFAIENPEADSDLTPTPEVGDGDTALPRNRITFLIRYRS